MKNHKNQKTKCVFPCLSENGVLTRLGIFVLFVFVGNRWGWTLQGYSRPGWRQCGIGTRPWVPWAQRRRDLRPQAQPRVAKPSPKFSLDGRQSTLPNPGNSSEPSQPSRSTWPTSGVPISASAHQPSPQPWLSPAEWRLPLIQVCL